MSAADHAAEARNCLGASGAYNGEDHAPLVAEAQVHATLALAEQQRLANIIAVANDPTGFLAVNLDDIRMGLAGEVWEGLGLS